MREETNSLILIFVVVCLMLYLILVGMVFFLMHLAQVRQKKHFQHIENLKKTQHEDVLKSKLSIQDDAFRTISRELHDNVSQRLSLLKFNVSSIPKQMQNIQQRTKMAMNSITEVMNITRNMSKNINPDYVMEKGLITVLKKEYEIISKATLVRDLQFNIPDEVTEFTPQNSLMIYRIIQEGVNNALKYSEGDKVVMSFRKTEGRTYTLSIVDNGKGFDVHDPNLDGLGMTSIKDRAAVLGADLKIESEPGVRTSITLIIPF